MSRSTASGCARVTQLACWTIRDLAIALGAVYALGVLIGLALPRWYRWVWWGKGRKP